VKCTDSRAWFDNTTRRNWRCACGERFTTIEQILEIDGKRQAPKNRGGEYTVAKFQEFQQRRQSAKAVSRLKERIVALIDEFQNEPRAEDPDIVAANHHKPLPSRRGSALQRDST